MSLRSERAERLTTSGLVSRFSSYIYTTEDYNNIYEFRKLFYKLLSFSRFFFLFHSIYICKYIDPRFFFFFIFLSRKDMIEKGYSGKWTKKRGGRNRARGKKRKLKKLWSKSWSDAGWSRYIYIYISVDGWKWISYRERDAWWWWRLLRWFSFS